MDPKRSKEYAANIFNAVIGDHTPFWFNGNVLNDGCITNLPREACVEIPVYASEAGFAKRYVGALPAHLAILVNITAAMRIWWWKRPWKRTGARCSRPSVWIR